MSRENSGLLIAFVLMVALPLFAVVAAQEPTPVETCGTDVAKKEAELRARICPDGFVGQWFQERAAGSCDWQPTEPQWYACAIEIEPQGPVDPGPGDMPP